VNKKYFLIITLAFFIRLPLIASDIPQELGRIGFTQYNLIDYEEKDRIEYFTFSDWRTEKLSDTVIFAVENDKIKEWFQGPNTFGGEVIEKKEDKKI